MVKSNFRFLFLVTVITACFASNLSAMQEVVKQGVEELSPTEEAFVKDFLDSVKKQQIKYDGKTLKLYIDKSSEAIRAISCAAMFMLMSLGCVICADGMYGHKRKTLDLCALGFGLLSAMSIFILFLYACIELFSRPLISIDGEKIELNNKMKMKWIDASMMKFLSDNTVMLCNKSGTPLLALDKDHLPIKFSELISLLGLYLNKYGAKDKAPALLPAGA